jgi:hypothetical protein
MDHLESTGSRAEIGHPGTEKAAPTPGPWSAVHGVLLPDDEGHTRSFIRPIKGEGYQIAQTVGPNGEANARLIAAAPDMLAALEQIAQGGNTVTSDLPYGRGKSRDEMASIARAALALAKGEA